MTIGIKKALILWCMKYGQVRHTQNNEDTGKTKNEKYVSAKNFSEKWLKGDTECCSSAYLLFYINQFWIYLE